MSCVHKLPMLSQHANMQHREICACLDQARHNHKLLPPKYKQGHMQTKYTSRFLTKCCNLQSTAGLLRMSCYIFWHCIVDVLFLFVYEQLASTLPISARGHWAHDFSTSTAQHDLSTSTYALSRRATCRHKGLSVHPTRKAFLKNQLLLVVQNLYTTHKVMFIQHHYFAGALTAIHNISQPDII